MTRLPSHAYVGFGSEADIGDLGPDFWQYARMYHDQKANVSDAIGVALLTAPGERIIRPDFGSSLRLALLDASR